MIPTTGAAQFVEKRAASTITSTAEVLPGTLVNVPSANPSGPVPDHPVVAVNTTSKWTDPQFLISGLTCLAATITSVVSLFPPAGSTIDWRFLAPAIAVAVIGGVQTFLRQFTNTTTR